MNKMKWMLCACLSLLLLAPTTAEAQMMPSLPIDEAVRTGVLPNGMTYYVRHNSLPEKQAYFYIVQKVGSVQEEESQRGLAHFLEHMAFNGSKNFPGNGMIDYTERIGVKFGQNLNAYTSTDETVYNIDQVPVSESNIDSCLLILHDWSGYLNLEDAEIDKERGVIHEEWRLRSSASQRILNRRLGELYPGSRYGARMPIGLMSVIDGCPYDTLRAYYHKWYRPNLQGIVVVGDIDADKVVEKIKAVFSDIPNPDNPAEYLLYPVPTTNEPIYVIDKDKEIANGSIVAFYKTDAMDREQRGSMAYLLQNYVVALITGPLNARLSELSQKPDCPFLQAGVSYGNYLISKTKDAFEVFVMPKPGKDAEAFQAVMQEIERASRYGLTGTEIYRANEEYLSRIEKIYDNRDKQYSSFFVPQYVRHFLEGNAIPSIETEYTTIKQISEQLSQSGLLDGSVNLTLQGLTASTDTNFVVLAFYPDKEGVTLPTEASLKGAVAAAKAAKLDAYVDNVKNEPLVSQLPKKGSIVKEEAADFGYTKWTLSNGAVVYVKQTDFNNSQVLLSAQSWGGYDAVSVKGNNTLLNAKLTDGVMGSTGLGNFKQTELAKALAGKQAGVNVSLGASSESLSGFATPKDLRTLFEQVYLVFTQPGNDPEAFANLIETSKKEAEDEEKQPETAFSDSVLATMYGHDIRVARVGSADYDKADYETIRSIYADRFNSPSDFQFFITGAYNVDSLRAFTEQYLASIPKAKRVEERKDPNLNFVNKNVTNDFKRDMETPKGNIIQVWHGEMPYTLKNAAVVEAFSSILSQRLLKDIREDHSFAYSCGAAGRSSYKFKEEYMVQIYCPSKPAKADSVMMLIRENLENVAAKGVTEEELNKVKEYELKNFATLQKNNSYWSQLIAEKVTWGKDLQTGYEDAVKSLTTADIQQFCRDILLKQGKCLTIRMLPTSLEEKDN